MDLLTFIDALLVTNPTNIRYLTGFAGSVPEEREAYVLLTKTQAYLFTNVLYREEAKRLTQNPISFKRLNLLGSLALQGLTLMEISREEPFSKKLAEILKRCHPAQRGDTLKRVRLGFEEHDLTVAEYHKIMHVHKNVTLSPTQNRVEELRMIKREDEIENIRAAAGLADRCFDFILGKLKPASHRRGSASRGRHGVTEGEIAWEIESFIRSRGAELAFSPIVAFGKNTSQPHHNVQPQGPALSVNHPNIVILDFGAKVNGYCSDMTRVVFVGKPKEEWVKAYGTVLQAQAAALEYLASRPGLEATGGKADRLAREVIIKAGFPSYPHSLGHGVGLDIHEAPRLTVKKDPSTSSGQALKPGMVVTIEPAIYKEGSYGIRIEDLVLLKKDGIEILSKSHKEMIIL
ncbi:aminopeptidase P family protein [Candidatus Gottesmanbacteria bacterium]|nr:aminopeptidase P family protein [Candidatus Gottesmanbacteria bacterium]